MSAAVFLFGVALCAVGILAYSGRWRRWADETGYIHSGGFAALFVGAAFAFLGIWLALPRETIPKDALFAVFAPLAVGGIFGILWMPKFMLPGWFVEGRAVRRNIERAVRHFRRTARRARKTDRKS